MDWLTAAALQETRAPWNPAAVRLRPTWPAMRYTYAQERTDNDHLRAKAEWMREREARENVHALAHVGGARGPLPPRLPAPKVGRRDLDMIMRREAQLEHMNDDELTWLSFAGEEGGDGLALDDLDEIMPEFLDRHAKVLGDEFAEAQALSELLAWGMRIEDVHVRDKWRTAKRLMRGEFPLPGAYVDLPPRLRAAITQDGVEVARVRPNSRGRRGHWTLEGVRGMPLPPARVPALPHVPPHPAPAITLLAQLQQRAIGLGRRSAGTPVLRPPSPVVSPPARKPRKPRKPRWGRVVEEGGPAPQ